MLLVRQTLISPFDRIDIQNLFSSLDDSIDQMKKTAKAITLFPATHFGAPVSTTQTITGAIVGVGLARQIVGAWVITLSAAGATGAMFYGLTTLFG